MCRENCTSKRTLKLVPRNMSWNVPWNVPRNLCHKMYLETCTSKLVPWIFGTIFFKVVLILIHTKGIKVMTFTFSVIWWPGVCCTGKNILSWNLYLKTFCKMCHETCCKMYLEMFRETYLEMCHETCAAKHATKCTMKLVPWNVPWKLYLETSAAKLVHKTCHEMYLETCTSKLVSWIFGTIFF